MRFLLFRLKSINFLTYFCCTLRLRHQQTRVIHSGAHKVPSAYAYIRNFSEISVPCYPFLELLAVYALIILRDCRRNITFSINFSFKFRNATSYRISESYYNLSPQARQLTTDNLRIVVYKKVEA